ncbi:MAG: methionyl-tRNA formyltransferase [Burkholderiales bacterium]
MRVVFAGTPEFAVAGMQALCGAGHELTLVLTRPDRPSGRGLEPAPSPIKRAATALGVEVLQPVTLGDSAVQARIRAARPDVLIVAAYGLILPQAVLDIAQWGALNIHASLLPRWRGAAPIQRAILAGDSVTGVSIMQMDAGLDTGPVLLQAETPIYPEDTAGTLHDRLALLGATLLVDALRALEQGIISTLPQASEGVTYAPKIAKSEARIDWARPALEIDRQVRAFNPFPGAVARIRDTEVKVWRVAVLAGSGVPGTVLRVGSEGIVVACGAAALELIELQRAGGKRLAAGDLLRGFPIAVGERFVSLDERDFGSKPSPRLS